LLIDNKNEILKAAFEAPTAGGMMHYSILDITDEELKKKLAVVCDNQPFIAQAPLSRSAEEYLKKFK